MRVLAHQGGWDEYWIPLGVLAVVIGFVVRALRHRGKGGPGSGKEGRCLYCGSELADGDDRCERCGFKKENR